MPLKCPFRSILQKFQRTVILQLLGEKSFKLLPDTPLDTSFQNNVKVSLQLFPFIRC